MREHEILVRGEHGSNQQNIVVICRCGKFRREMMQVSLMDLIDLGRGHMEDVFPMREIRAGFLDIAQHEITNGYVHGVDLEEEDPRRAMSDAGE